MDVVEWFVIGFFCAWFIAGAIMNLVIKWFEEKPYPINRHNARVFIVRILKRSSHLMNWLNKPEKPQRRGACNVLHR
jgi:hypothetical protein